ncbi:MAG: exov-like protein [Litoreibacter sp.]
MKPFYYGATTNFGDHMNSWLWPELIPDLLEREDDIRLIGIGSLLSRNLDMVAGRKVVFGTGSGYSSLPTPEQAANWDVFAVRGPLTAKYLGLPPEKAITDGAWLINRIPRYAAIPETREGTVFVPHWTSAAYGDWPRICAESDISYVDPLWDCDTVFSKLANAKLAIVESLHGAIIADYYRTPWIPVASPGRVLKYKWIDWCQSLNLEYHPYMLPPSDYVDFRLQGFTPQIASGVPEHIAVDPDTFDVRETPSQPGKAGIIHRGKVKAKGVLRQGRGYALKGVAQVRNSIFFRNWNKQQSEALQRYFDTLKTAEPYLSDDTIRATRIEQLNAAFDDMVARYGTSTETSK